MGCYNRNRHHAFEQKQTKGDCVADTVKNIIKAQNEVMDDDCATSCHYSIQQLRGKGNELGPRYSTIPFVLYCGGTCKPFIGSGIFKNPADHYKNTFFGCVETPVFRAKQFAKNDNNCVTLELLAPASSDYEIKSYCMDKGGDVCRFFSEEEPVCGFLATGICLTVDLNHFMGITCLDPINPM